MLRKNAFFVALLLLDLACCCALYSADPLGFTSELEQFEFTTSLFDVWVISVVRPLWMLLLLCCVACRVWHVLLPALLSAAYVCPKAVFFVVDESTALRMHVQSALLVAALAIPLVEVASAVYCSRGALSALVSDRIDKHDYTPLPRYDTDRSNHHLGGRSVSISHAESEEAYFTDDEDNLQLWAEQEKAEMESSSIEDLLAHWRGWVEQAKSAFQEEKLLEASKLIRRVELLRETHESVLLEHGVLDDVLAALQDPMCDRIRAEEANCRRLVAEFESPSGWTLISNSGGIATYFTQAENSSCCRLRAEGEVETCIENMLAVLAEIDLAGNWLPSYGPLGMQSVAELERVGPVEKSVYMLTGLPWPIASRYVLMQGKGADMLAEKGCLLILIQSIEISQLSPRVEPPNIPKGAMACDVEFGGFLFSPLSPTRTRMQLMFQVDPHLAYIPTSLVNWVMKMFLHKAFVTLGEAAIRVPGSQYEERMKSDVLLYEKVRTRARDYLQQNGLM